MEKINSGKTGKNRRKSYLDLPKLPETDDPSIVNYDDSFLDVRLQQISDEINRLADEFSALPENSASPDIPDTLHPFLNILESVIKTQSSTKPGTRIANMVQQHPSFTEAITSLAKMRTVLNELFPQSLASYDRITNLLQQAMAFMEDEFQALLLDSTPSSVPPPTPKSEESKNEDDFPGYSKENMILMNKIAAVMIHAGYENECCQVYIRIRKGRLHEQVKRFGFDKGNVEDVHKSKWVSLEPEISRWVKLVRHCFDVVFPGERSLGEAVFSGHPLVFRGVVVNVLYGVTTSFLEFATAVATVKPKAKRLFKFLDVYEALRDLGTAVDEADPGDVKLEESRDLRSEISSATDGVGEAVVGMFSELKSSIRNDNNKTPIQRGGVHPLTRYAMSYVKCGFDDYAETLEYIFRRHVEDEGSSDGEKYPALSKQLLSVIELLDANLETKAALYKDPSLRCIFLMNNDRYVLQMVKGETEMREVIGENWCRRKSSDVRNHHKNYQRETWNKVLQCITQEGIQVNGKPSRKIVKERLKSFNGMLDDICKTQSTWVVSDQQLLSEVRVSITAVVSPAYRSFVGRYRPQFEGGKSIDKYIKYQPEEVESMIDTLFEGTDKVESEMNGIQPASTVKVKTGAFKSLLKTYKNVGLL